MDDDCLNVAEKMESASRCSIQNNLFNFSSYNNCHCECCHLYATNFITFLSFFVNNKKIPSSLCE